MLAEPLTPVSKANTISEQSSKRLKVLEVKRVNSQRLEILAIEISNNNNNNKTKDQSAKTSTNGVADANDGAQINNNNKDDLSSSVQTIKLVIEGVWATNAIPKNSIIHLLNAQHEKSSNVYTINNSAGYLVTEPDNLLTCTLVASSLFCERKTWLNQVFAGQAGTNRAMLVGTLVHEVFQHGVKNRIADIEKLTKFLDDLLDDATVMLETYSVELHIKDIRNEAISYISSVKEWIDKYMFSGPRYPLTNDPDLEVKIIGINDIEENVWSTKYGLKGKIDVTGSVRIYDKKAKGPVDRIIPLELKTGNPNLSSSHSAQVSLYSMMIEDRYAETNQGFVIYLKNKAAMHNVALTHNIRRDLIQRRNQINYHQKDYFLGPDMIDQTRVCKSCERLTECVLMSQLYSPGNINHFPSMKALENEATGHLDEKFVKFFQKYHEKLIRIMAKKSPPTPAVNGSAGDSHEQLPAGSFWTYSSEEAEAKGTGFGKLQAIISDDKSKSSFIKFKRHPDYRDNYKDDNDSSSSSQASNGPAVKRQRIEDYFKPIKAIVVAAAPNAKPFDTKLDFSRCRIAVSLDNDDQNMDSQNSSTAIAIGFMSELKEDYFVLKIYEGALDALKPNLMYRVDKLEKRSQIDIERAVLVRLLAREDWRCDRVRRLLLDPKFLPEEDLEFNLFVLTTGLEEISELDADQQKFVVEAVSTDNYYILNEKAEPKKSQVNKDISILTRVITVLGRSTLIVAQNIDNLVELMKLLQQSKVKFILIDDGKSTKARHLFASNLVKVVQVASWDLSKKFDSYIKQHEQAQVVITSYAMSIGGLLFTRRTFDYCVAYDCDTVELLISLSPMFCSNRFIIVDVRDSADNGEQKKTNGSSNDVDISLGNHLRALKAKGSATSSSNAVITIE